MITSKQRAFLRGLANSKKSTFQIGKGGVSDVQIDLINQALEKHEIVKIHLLENALADVKEICHEVSALTKAEEVQVIGSRFVLYKQSRENKTIDLKNLKVIEKPKKDEKAVKGKKQPATQKTYKSSRGINKAEKGADKKGIKKRGR